MRPNSEEIADSFTFTKQILNGTVMQTEKGLINDHLRVSKIYEVFAFPIFVCI